MKLLIALFLLLLALNQQTSPQTSSEQTSHIFTKKISRTTNGKYLLYVPKEYKNTRKQYPVIMYLHDGSLRGEDVEKLRTMGLPALLETDKSFPFIVISPLCPAGEIWTDTDMLIGIMDEISSKYRVDAGRVYLTGH